MSQPAIPRAPFRPRWPTRSSGLLVWVLFVGVVAAGIVTPAAAAPPADAAEPAAPAEDAAAPAERAPLGPGSRTLTVPVQGRSRTALVHLPPGKVPRPEAGWPVVLAFHGAGMNGPMMAWFSGLSATADTRGFIVVYPDGTGRGPFLVWNAGGFGRGGADDVAFVAALLDELADAAPIDPRRIYACGLSNGGMMCYRLAAELSDRIAAIAPVAGVNMIREPAPARPVPVIHFHGSADGIVPYGPEIAGERPAGAGGDAGGDAERGAAARENRAADPPRRERGWRLPGVGDSVQAWVTANGCGPIPLRDALTGADDPLPVSRLRWRDGRDGSEVVLVRIEGGGHTWPGKKPPVGFIGRSTTAISANELIWEFFERHPRP